MKQLLGNGVSYSFIKTDRFKTTLISVGFYTAPGKFSAADSLTLRLMKSGTAELPDNYSFNRKLASLYGTSVMSSSSKACDAHELLLALLVNDDRYSLKGEKNVAAAGKLLCEMIFSHFENGTLYPADVIGREKRLLAESIENSLNDKRLYARKRCEEIMCADEPFGFLQDGTAAEVMSLTAEDVRESISRLLKTALINVTVIGTAEPEGFIDTFRKAVSGVGRNYIPLAENIAKPAGELKTTEEKMLVGQGKLVIGFRSATGGNDTDTVSDLVMADIFGGGPYSKLFCNVREKMSLCYYCSARNIRRKGLIFVESGVEDDKIPAAKTAILDQLSDISAGKVSDKEFSSSVRSITDSVSSVGSDQFALMKWYSARALDENPATPEEICGLVRKVTPEDVIKAAAKYKPNTIYILRPDGSAKEENL